jgi:hypothetical protein
LRKLAYVKKERVQKEKRSCKKKTYRQLSKIDDLSETKFGFNLNFSKEDYEEVIEADRKYKEYIQNKNNINEDLFFEDFVTDALLNKIDEAIIGFYDESKMILPDKIVDEYGVLYFFLN